MSELLYKTLRESVVNAIRTKIMKRQIRLGERIVELELAQEFHTSRGPIREALRQLEIEGLVEYIRNVGCSDCEKICQEVKKHYWRTIHLILQEQGNEDTELEKNWMMAI